MRSNSGAQLSSPNRNFLHFLQTCTLEGIETKIRQKISHSLQPEGKTINQGMQMKVDPT